ncbi:hypothetical protein [Kribbella sp. NPDC049584]|uniref:hypothetical protein n=1 Tax=Kribbella sp. NPDC049584 TaxID=3154833 RepID=UPI00343AE5A5
MAGKSFGLLCEALMDLAAEPDVQEQRLAGMVIRDELALDFANSYEVSQARGDELDPVAWHVLDLISAELSVPPGDPLWSEDLQAARWSRLRLLASEALAHVPG